MPPLISQTQGELLNQKLTEDRYGLRYFNLIENYIYLHHLDKFIVLPVYPDHISDSMSANFSSSTPIGRSAPIWSYSSSGPRTVQMSFSLHRELMKQVNTGVSNINTNEVALGDDYVDTLLKYLQASVIPEYGASEKMVNPPMVSVRLGDDLFIKGIINGSVSYTWNLPILRDGKYASVDLNFAVTEVDPYSASDVLRNGSFRGLSSTLERRLWTAGSRTL